MLKWPDDNNSYHIRSALPLHPQPHRPLELLLFNIMQLPHHNAVSGLHAADQRSTLIALFTVSSHSAHPSIKCPRPPVIAVQWPQWMAPVSRVLPPYTACHRLPIWTRSLQPKQPPWWAPPPPWTRVAKCVTTTLVAARTKRRGSQRNLNHRQALAAVAHPRPHHHPTRTTRAAT